MLTDDLVRLLQVHHCQFELRVWTIVETGERQDRVGVVENQNIGFALADRRVEQLVVANLRAVDWAPGRFQMQLPVVIYVFAALAEAHLHVDAVCLFCGDLEEHVLFRSNLDMLGVIHYIQQDRVLEDELLPIAAIDESVLDERVDQVQFVGAHDALFILHDWRSLQFETEWNILETCTRREPVSDLVFLLVENDQFVLATRQYHVNVEFVLADLRRFDA